METHTPFFLFFFFFFNLLAVKDIVKILQFSVPKTVHVLDVERQLVVDHLILIPLIPALRLKSKELEKRRDDRVKYFTANEIKQSTCTNFIVVFAMKH